MAKSEWFVRLTKGRRRVRVHADYHTIEGGVLRFKNSERGRYPVNVMAFAAGEWLSVENLSIPVSVESVK
jgi:hypothetical protein